MSDRVRAIIVRDGKIILIKRTKSDSTYWVFPGGGVEAGETKQQALIREVKEELGLDIAVKDLLISRPSAHPETSNSTEYFFIAEILLKKIPDDVFEIRHRNPGLHHQSFHLMKFHIMTRIRRFVPVYFSGNDDAIRRFMGLHIPNLNGTRVRAQQ